MHDGIVPMIGSVPICAQSFEKGNKVEKYKPISLTTQICKLFESIMRYTVVCQTAYSGLSAWL